MGKDDAAIDGLVGPFYESAGDDALYPEQSEDFILERLENADTPFKKLRSFLLIIMNFWYGQNFLRISLAAKAFVPEMLI